MDHREALETIRLEELGRLGFDVTPDSWPEGWFATAIADRRGFGPRYRIAILAPAGEPDECASTQDASTFEDAVLAANLLIERSGWTSIGRFEASAGIRNLVSEITRASDQTRCSLADRVVGHLG